MAGADIKAGGWAPIAAQSTAGRGGLWLRVGCKVVSDRAADDPVAGRSRAMNGKGRMAILSYGRSRATGTPRRSRGGRLTMEVYGRG